jgi:hypothetical protein
MSSSHEVMSDRLFYSVAHPSQTSRFYLALVFSVLLFPLIAAGLIAGTIFLIVPAIAFLLWVGARVLFARLLGNAILVSEVNYPRVYQIAEELKVRMGYPKAVFIFVYEQGSFNAYMRHIFLRRAIFLNSEILETGVSDDEVRWLVGRFIGYMRARRQAGALGWLIRAAQHLIIFNLFILPYERAMVYTGDRLAVAAIDGDISSAVSAMQKLLVGRQLGYSVNPEGIAQQRQLYGSIFALLARLMSGFPHMTTRYVDLIAFAQGYYPGRFATFAAANPGLPAHLPVRHARPASDPLPAPEQLEAAGRPPHGWICAGATVALVAVVGLLAYAGAGSQPAAPPVATPAVSTTPIRPSYPHLHQSANGSWTPDPGCHWLNNDANDLRVQCN